MLERLFPKQAHLLSLSKSVVEDTIVLVSPYPPGLLTASQTGGATHTYSPVLVHAYVIVEILTG